MNLLSMLMSVVCFFAISVPANYELQTEEIITEEVILEEEIIINDADEYFEEYIYCSVDASTVSVGEIIQPREIVFNGENCAEILVDLLETNGLKPIYYGTTDEDFYLTGVGGIDTSVAQVTEELKAFLAENGIDYIDSVSDEGILGEFDFTDAAGWVYTVNGEMPDVGMNNYIPAAGDEIKLSFTLYYGEDINLID